MQLEEDHFAQDQEVGLVKEVELQDVDGDVNMKSIPITNKTSALKLVSGNQEGPCNKPGYPPCKQEYISMLGDYRGKGPRDLNKSYYNSLVERADEYSEGGKRSNYIHPGDITRSIRGENTRRYEDIKSSPAYDKFVNNPNAGPIIKGLGRELSVLEGKSGGYPTLYQIPTRDELGVLNKLAEKYADSEDINKDLNLVDKARGFAKAFKISQQYPNLMEIYKKKTR